MSEIKVRLSMEVPGATMLSSQDCEKMSKKKDAFDHTTIVVEHQVKEGKETGNRKRNPSHQYKEVKARKAVHLHQQGGI